MLNDVGGFIENSHVTGRPASDRRHSPRGAEFTLRLPQKDLDGVVAGFEAFGAVIFLRREAENVTAQFIDTESRLTALRIQEERLLHMLAQTTQVSVMLDIEERLSDVRADIERHTSRLMNLQTQVDFSTVTLIVYEVEAYTPTGEELSYWQQMGEDFTATLRGVGLFFATLFRHIISASPALVVIALAIFLPVWLTGKHKKKRQQAHKASQAAPGANTNDATDTVTAGETPQG